MKILIAVDDDAESQATLEFADRLIREGDDVSVLHVARGVTPYVAGPFGGYVMLPSTQNDLDMQEHAEEVVERDAAAILSVEAKELVDHGDPAERICATAAEHDTDLIIVGSQDRGAFGRFLHGSVSESVVRHAHCSVLVAKSNEESD